MHDRLQKLTGVTIATGHAARQREQLDFVRPECSRILEAVKGRPAHDEALKLIRTAAARLKTRPRADMDGFVPNEADRARAARYRKRLAEERRVYESIRNGKKVYDE